VAAEAELKVELVVAVDLVVAVAVEEQEVQVLRVKEIMVEDPLQVVAPQEVAVGEQVV
jgi:hypothetical protein